MRSNPEDREKTMRRFRERRENVERLRAELYAASPDMALIEQLRLREMELQRETLAEANLRSERFLRTLGPEDRLKFLRMEFGLPPLIVIPDKRAPAIGH
jgi:hypothetical protein